MQTWPAWIEQELQNWSRWCWSGPRAFAHLWTDHCGSIEWQYTRVNPEGQSDNARPLPPNSARAEIVDGVWRRLPEIPHLVLRAEYPQRGLSGRRDHGQVGAARRLHIRLSQYEDALAVAVGRVRDELERRIG